MNNTRRKKIRLVIEQLETIRDNITEIFDEEQDCYDNLPESLIDSERACVMSEAIENLSGANDSIDEVISFLEEAEV